MSIFTAINNAFESTASSSKYYSILSKLITKPGNTLTGTTFEVNKELYDFLSNYSFLRQLLKRIASTISDVFNKSSMRVSLGEELKDKADEVNDFLTDIQVMDVIKMDLKMMLYHGNYGYKINFKDTRIERLVDSINVLTEDTYCKDLHLVIDDWDDSDEGSSKDYVLLPYQYNPARIEDITELDAYLRDQENSSDINTLASEYLAKHPNANKVIKHSVYKGTGVLDSVMYLLLLLYMKELLLDLLGLKDTLRPDILTARVMDDRTDEVKIVQAMNDIESLVNQGSPSANGDTSGFSMFSNFQSMLTAINAFLVNGIKVVPEMNNFTSISKLDIPSLIDKRQRLQQECDDLRKRILETLGIDDSMSDNKWDAMQKNSKYLTMIEEIVDSISLFIRNTAYSFIKYKYPKETIGLGDIKLDLDTTNIIFNQYSLTRSRVLNDKVDALTRLMRTINDWQDMPCIDSSKVPEYIEKMVCDLDPTAAVLFKKAEDIESGEPSDY